MTVYPLETVFHFSDQDGHPPSKIVGIDHYQCAAEDGSHQRWASYTLVPINPDDQQRDYQRWYVVDMPHPYGFTVFYLEKELSPLDNYEKALIISGKVTVQSDGDAVLGTGHGQLECYVDHTTDPPTIYSQEFFDGVEPLYFRAVPLKSDPTIV